MKFFLTCDVDWESRVDQIRSELAQLGLIEYLENRDYGEGLHKIAVVLVCLEPELRSKPRVRLSRGNLTLDFDVLLDLQKMKVADFMDRRREVATRLLSEARRVLEKYALRNFNTQQFLTDLESWFQARGWT